MICSSYSISLHSLQFRWIDSNCGSKIWRDHQKSCCSNTANSWNKSARLYLITRRTTCRIPWCTYRTCDCFVGQTCHPVEYSVHCLSEFHRGLREGGALIRVQSCFSKRQTFGISAHCCLGSRVCLPLTLVVWNHHGGQFAAFQVTHVLVLGRSIVFAIIFYELMNTACTRLVWNHHCGQFAAFFVTHLLVVGRYLILLLFFILVNTTCNVGGMSSSLSNINVRFWFWFLILLQRASVS